MRNGFQFSEMLRFNKILDTPTDNRICLCLKTENLGHKQPPTLESRPTN